MVDKVIERPAYTPPVPGAEPAFINQLLQTTQQHGYAINQLIDAFEFDTFTPVLTFSTPGDLSVVYVVQAGWYWRIGQLLHVIVRVQATPTFTTASGNLRITGLPYPAHADIPFQFLPVQLSATGIAYPTGTYALATISGGASLFQFNTQGSAAAAGTVAAANVTSGVSTAGLHISGTYITDSFDNP